MPKNNVKNPFVTIHDAARLTGLSAHMITYLGRIDLVRPSRAGRGRPRQFTFSDIIFMRLIADLLKRGIEVKRLKHSLQKAKAQTELWIDIRHAPSRYLVTDGTEVFIQRQGQLESKTLNGQLAFAFVLDMGIAHRAVAASWPDTTQVRSKARN
jgi:DNA-binding transcriptional MerR regulator